MQSVYIELKSWQGAIGSVLGFAALFAGALWNFRLNRRRDALLRAEEVAAIAAALHGEIGLVRDAVANLARHYSARSLALGLGSDRREIDSYFVDDLRLPEPLLYRALATKVGMLPAEVVAAIVAFYANASAAETYLKKMIPDEKRGYAYSPLYVLEPARDAVCDVEPALRRLETIAGLPEAAPTLELGRTLDVIAIEREFQEQHLEERAARSS